MDVARQHFLAGAALAAQQHRGVGRGDPARELQQLDRFARHRHRILVACGRPGAQARDHLEQLRRLERFHQVVGGPVAHRLHRALDAAEGRDQHHRHLRMQRADASQQFVAVHAAHVDIGDHDIDRILREQRERLGRAGCRHDATARQLQGVGERLAQLRIVLDDQRARAAHAVLTHGRDLRHRRRARAAAATRWHRYPAPAPSGSRAPRRARAPPPAPPRARGPCPGVWW